MVIRSAALRYSAALICSTGIFAAAAAAQQAPPATPQAAGRGAGRGGGRGPTVVSPEVMPDRTVTFRVLAPKAETVALNGNDITVLFQGGGAGPLAASNIVTQMPATPMPNTGPTFKKNDTGIWEATVGPLPPGAYRYTFTVDGVRVLDPVNTRTAESRDNIWSVFSVSGSDMLDTTDVPHGAVAEVFYYSQVLKTTRRLHVYTPPGYESGNQKYPVFYLLHGSGDTDDAWVSVGRSNFILDNLIAAKKAKPMIVVMPAGHQPGNAGFGGGGGGATAGQAPTVNPFTNEFMTDMLPYVEKHYRTINDRQHRAIAGLSMGGGQTMDIAFSHLDMFAEIGVFSSGAGLGGGGGRRGGAAPAAAPQAAPAAPAGPSAWETNHAASLDNASLKKGTKLIWLSTGVDDGLLNSSTKPTVEMLKKHGFEPVFTQSAGAHSWFNWRNYLITFTPLLFQ